MKNIFILGVGRAGKSTLSRMLRKKLVNYDLIHIDAIRNGILFNIEEKYKNDFMNYSENEFFQKMLLDFVDAQIYNGQENFGVILEGAQILPKVLYNYKNLKNTVVVFLGHGNLSKDEIYEMVRNNDTQKDWSFGLDDEKLKEYINEFKEKNDFILSECGKYNFKYVDTSMNRDIILKEVLNYILDRSSIAKVNSSLKK